MEREVRERTESTKQMERKVSEAMEDVKILNLRNASGYFGRVSVHSRRRN